MAKNNRVLVVSPDPGLINQVRGSLISVSVHDVSDVANAEQALEAFEREKARLVIAEVDLPGVTGQELCRRLKERGDEAPVVALIYRHGDAIGKDQCERAGADTSAGRPFQGLEFIDKLRDVINSPAFNESRIESPVPAASLDDSVSDESLYSDYEFDAGDSVDDVAVLNSLSINPADTAEMAAVHEQGESEEVAMLENPTARTQSSVRIASLPATDFDMSFLPETDGSPTPSESSGTLREMIATHLQDLTGEGSDFREAMKALICATVAQELRRLGVSGDLGTEQDD